MSPYIHTSLWGPPDDPSKWPTDTGPSCITPIPFLYSIKMDCTVGLTGQFLKGWNLLAIDERVRMMRWGPYFAAGYPPHPTTGPRWAPQLLIENGTGQAEQASSSHSPTPWVVGFPKLGPTLTLGYRTKRKAFAFVTFRGPGRLDPLIKWPNWHPYVGAILLFLKVDPCITINF